MLFIIVQLILSICVMTGVVDCVVAEIHSEKFVKVKIPLPQTID